MGRAAAHALQERCVHGLSGLCCEHGSSVLGGMIWCNAAMPAALQAAGPRTVRPCQRAAPWMLSQSCLRLPLPLSSPAVDMPAAAVSAQVDPALVAWATGGTAAAALPAASTRVIEVHRLSTDFRAATHIVQRPLPAALPPGTVLIRRAFVGVNASDVNYSGA